MKKLINLLIVLIVLYFGIELLFINLNKGHVIEYKIKENDKVFNIKEVFTQKVRNEKSNYYIEITVDDSLFVYQTYNDYKKANYLVKKIDYYKDDKFNCISLINKDNVYLTDIICKKDNIQYLYSNIKGQDKNLDEYVKQKEKYKMAKDDKTSKIDASPVILYDNNLIDNHYLVLQNYKGVYLINKKNNVKNISVYKNDVYTNDASILNGKNYIMSDYNQEFKFHKFYVINITNGKQDKIISNDEISLESYMQGSINNEVYLFDKSDKKQYRINVKNKTVSLSGKASEGIQMYENNSFKTGSAYDASNNDKKFNRYTVSTKFNGIEYSKVDKVGNKLSGFYYLYKKNNSKYDVYKVNVQNKKVLTYLFTTDSLETYYYQDYVYYKDGSYIKYYQENTSYKTLLKDKELKFNKALSFGLFVG